MSHSFCIATTALLSSVTFLETVIACIDNKLNVDTIYLDLAKTFDKVLHERFLAFSDFFYFFLVSDLVW